MIRARLTTGGRGSRANLIGGSVLDSDPQVESAGVDTGFATAPGTLRAPDVAVGNVAEAPGMLRNPVPVLALFDREAAHEATLRNLLQRKGYRDLD